MQLDQIILAIAAAAVMFILAGIRRTLDRIETDLRTLTTGNTDHEARLRTLEKRCDARHSQT